MTARLTKARLALLMAAAKDTGGRVTVNLAKGEAVIDFAAPANEHGPEDEAARIEQKMNESMGGDR